MDVLPLNTLDEIKSMNKKYRVLCSVLLGLFIHGQSYAASDTFALKQLEATAQQAQSLCQQIALTCDKSAAWQLYQVSEQPEQYYVIAQLQLFQLTQTNKTFRLLNQWDFSDYQPKQVNTHWTVEEASKPSDERHLYPALFRVSEQSYAIGLIQRFNEMYSGGGMTEEVADFFELKANSKAELMFSNLPFYVTRMIRACFSQEDYERAGDVGCHDNENMLLNIRYQKPYQWQLNYRYTRVLSAVSDQKPANGRARYVVQAKQFKPIQLPTAWQEY